MFTFKGYLGGGVLQKRIPLGHVRIEFQVYFLPVLSCFSGSVPDHLGVNSARYTVVQLGVELGQNIGVVHGGIRNISDSGSLHNITDDKFADSLVLGAGLAAVGATDVLDMAAAVLGTSIILPLFGHLARFL